MSYDLGKSSTRSIATKEMTWEDAANADLIRCIMSDAMGVYIPQHFADNWPDRLSSEDAEILLSGPDHRYYWETWDDVLNYATLIDADGLEWHLYQDGDLFAIRADVELDPESY